MINKKMGTTDSWQESTPLQFRHDSGYGSYLKHYELLELSPIRKQSSSEVQQKDKVEYLGTPKRLMFLNLSNNCDNSESDSGIASSVNESVFENDNLPTKGNECIKDENSNFTCLIDSGIGTELYQPLKYLCKDKACSKGTKYTAKIFRSYAIASDLFKSEKNSRVDFLYELDIRNCTSIISDIFSYLSDEDLRQVNNVSKRWQDIVLSDKNASNRRILYIKNKKNAACGPNKENKNKSATPVERDHKSAFTSLVNVENDKQPLTFDIFQGRFDSFIRELKTEGNQKALIKCPKCRYPARVEAEFRYCCTRNLCKHEFCKKCLGPFLDNHKCSVPELNDLSSNVVVGSKKSRKNLRRLKA